MYALNMAYFYEEKMSVRLCASYFHKSLRNFFIYNKRTMIIYCVNAEINYAYKSKNKIYWRNFHNPCSTQLFVPI